MAHLPGKKMQKGWFSTGDIAHVAVAGTAFLALLVLAFSCQRRWEDKETHTLKTDSIQNQYIGVADSINYGVVVKNRKESDQWQEKWLSSFERKAFVDHIFEAVYQGKLQPYDYFTHEPMTIEQVEKLEAKASFSRERVGKIQFKERWYFDPQQLSMVKEVHQIMLAYEVYRDDGSFRGYKPAFMVRLNPNLKKANH